MPPNKSVAPYAEMLGLDYGKMASLAAELGAKLIPTEEVLRRFSLGPKDLAQLLKDPQFRHMVTDFRREWSSPMSAKDRIKLKSLLMVEENLLTLHTLFSNTQTNPTARLSAFKQMVDLADAAPAKAGVEGGGSKFHLTLNLGSHAATPFTIDAVTQQIIDDKDENA
jgi:hypothetical protein